MIETNKREKVKRSAGTEWTLRTLESDAPQPGSATIAASPPLSTPDAKRSREEAEELMTDAKRRKPAKSETKEEKDKRVQQEKKAAREKLKDKEQKAEVAKRITGAMKKCNELKGKCDKACQAAADVLRFIASDDAWAWASNNVVLAPLRSAVEKVEGHKVANNFWKAWTQKSEDFAPWVKQHMEVDAVELEVGKAFEGAPGSFLDAVKALTKQANALRAMHMVKLQREA